MNYGKKPDGTLVIELRSEDVPLIYEAIVSSGLCCHRRLHGLQACIEDGYGEEVRRWRNGR